MKKILLVTLFILLTISHSNAQNQSYTIGTNTYTFNSVGTFQLTGLPAGANIQIECYGGGGGGGGAWTAHYASTSSGGAGGGGYSKLNTFSTTGAPLDIIVGNGGLKGTGNATLQVAYDGGNGNYSAVYAPNISDTICKATGGKGSLHVSASNGSTFSPATALGTGGVGGQGTIGDLLQNGTNGTTGAVANFLGNGDKGGDGGNGAGPSGGAGGLFANSVLANYGVAGSPYGGGGSGCADYEGSGGATYKMGGDGANGGVIITILSINTLDLTTQTPTLTTFCTGDTIVVPYTATGTFNGTNVFNLQLSDATGSFTSAVLIGTINSTVSGNINGIIPLGTIAGTGYRLRVDATDPSFVGTDNGTDLTIKAKPTAPVASTQDFCGNNTIANLIPSGTDTSWYSASTSSVPLINSEILITQQYYVTRTINGCESDKTPVQVNSNPIPTIDAGMDQIICDGTSATLTATNPDGATINWNNGITDGVSFIPVYDSITYTVTATKNGCTNSDSLLVSIAQNPIAMAVDTLPSICKKETSIMMYGSIGGAATAGTWIGGTGTWNNASNPQNATYTSSVTDPTGWIALKLITSGGSCPADTAICYIEIKDCILSIPQNEVENSLKFYPNPAYNSFEIEDDHLTINYSLYQLISMNGKIVQSGKIDSNHQKIDVQKLDKGFYLLQLTGEKSTVLKLEVR